MAQKRPLEDDNGQYSSYDPQMEQLRDSLPPNPTPLDMQNAQSAQQRQVGDQAVTQGKDMGFYDWMKLPENYKTPIKTANPTADGSDDDDRQPAQEMPTNPARQAAEDAADAAKPDLSKYAGPTPEDYEEYTKQRTPGFFTKLFGALNSKESHGDYDEMMNRGAVGPLLNKQFAEAYRQKQLQQQQNAPFDDPNSFQSRFYRAQLQQKLRGMGSTDENGQRNPNAGDFGDLEKSLPGMTANQIKNVMGIEGSGGRRGTSAMDFFNESDDGGMGKSGDPIKRARLVNQSVQQIHKNPDVRLSNQKIATGEAAIDAMNNPNIIYTSQMHNELNVGFARLISGRGAVLPVSSEDRIKMKTAQESLANTLQYFIGKPINSVPDAVKQQLREGITRLNDYYTKLRSVQARRAAMGMDWKGMGAEANANEALGEYGTSLDGKAPVAASDTFSKQSQQNGQGKPTPEYVQAVKDKLKENPNHPKRAQWETWLKQNGG